MRITIAFVQECTVSTKSACVCIDRCRLWPMHENKDSILAGPYRISNGTAVGLMPPHALLQISKGKAHNQSEFGFIGQRGGNEP